MGNQLTCRAQIIHICAIPHFARLKIACRDARAAADALKIAERLLQEIESPEVTGAHKVTATYGVAQYDLYTLASRAARGG